MLIALNGSYPKLPRGGCSASRTSLVGDCAEVDTWGQLLSHCRLVLRATLAIAPILLDCRIAKQMVNYLRWGFRLSNWLYSMALKQEKNPASCLAEVHIVHRPLWKQQRPILGKRRVQLCCSECTSTGSATMMNCQPPMIAI